MNKHELKYQRTSEQMYQALIDILKKKRIEEVSVTELCILANINRSTFYAHFETIDDLLNETKRYIINLCRQDVRNQAKVERLLSSGTKINISLITEAYLKPFLSVVKSMRDIFIIPEFSHLSVLFNENENKILERIFMPDVKHTMDEKTGKYLALYFFSGVDSVTQKWLNEGCKDSVEEICSIILKCMAYKFE